MKDLYALAIFCCFVAACKPQNSSQPMQNIPHGPITIVIHGGAGTILRENMTPEKEKMYHDALIKALDNGYRVLEKGGKSLDAVIAAIKTMEDSPLFNAGKGSVFTFDGKNEMDASIMDGSNLMAGAVAGVTTIKNPIEAAYSVMTKSPHVFLSGRGAEQFASEQGLTIVDPSYFFDSIRYEQLQKVKFKETASEKKFGTVGAVALDQFGNLAAGTSTGGMTNKKWGRIGDSPVIGAGTYANNKTCAVSATGHGEYFIRLSVAHNISSMMEYGNVSLDTAVNNIILKQLTNLGGEGGVIALDRAGNFSMTFNSAGMYRGFKQHGKSKTSIYHD